MKTFGIVEALGRMPFLPPNQRRLHTEGMSVSNTINGIHFSRVSVGIFARAGVFSPSSILLSALKCTCVLFRLSGRQPDVAW